jgi:hypothetical protein
VLKPRLGTRRSKDTAAPALVGRTRDTTATRRLEQSAWA